MATTTEPASPATAHLDVDPRAVVRSWRGARVVLEGRLLPERLWLAADLTVAVDGNVVLHTGGQRGLTGAQTSTFVHEGAHHEVVLRWGVAPSAQQGFPVTVTIDGEAVVVDELVALRNAGMVWLIPGVTVALCVLLGAAAFFLHW